MFLRVLILGSLILTGLTLWVNVALADPDPFSCTGYPESRTYLASQSWWTDSDGDFSGGAGGLTEHSHSEVCFPLYQVVDGTVHFDVVSKIHNLEGEHARVRIQDGSTTLIQVDTPVCGTTDCTFVTPININMGSRKTGTHEMRIHTESRAGTPSGGTYPKQNLATNGWQLCVRTCSVNSTAVPWPAIEGRGWYDTPTIDIKGYITARMISTVPTGFVPDLWCPIIRIVKGSAEGQDDTPVDSSFASIDPNFHAGDPGLVVLNQAGPYNQAPLCIDTTVLTPGPHKLFLQAHSQGLFPGQLWGGLVVPFQVEGP